jgi:hypothetical protein
MPPAKARLYIEYVAALLTEGGSHRTMA